MVLVADRVDIRLAAVLVGRTGRVERDGRVGLAGLDPVEHVLLGDLEELRQLGDGRRSSVPGGDQTGGVLDPAGALLGPSRDVHGPTGIAEIALELAQDRWDGEGGERQAAAGVEAVDRLDQAEGRDLDQVLERLAGVAVAAGEALGQREVLRRQLVASARILTLLPAGEKLGIVRAALLRCGRRVHWLAPFS